MLASPHPPSFGYVQSQTEKYRIQETLNLSACADSSTNIKTDRKVQKGIYYHNLCVRCRVSPVTNTSSQSHRPSPLPTPALCILGWFAKPTNPPPKKKEEKSKGLLRPCLIALARASFNDAWTTTKASAPCMEAIQDVYTK